MIIKSVFQPTMRACSWECMEMTRSGVPIQMRWHRKAPSSQMHLLVSAAALQGKLHFYLYNYFYYVKISICEICVTFKFVLVDLHCLLVGPFMRMECTDCTRYACFWNKLFQDIIIYGMYTKLVFCFKLLFQLLL